MAIYTKRPGIRGSTIYKMDHKFIKTADVPGNVLELLEIQDSVDDENLQMTKPMKPCVFCKVPSKLSRIINQQTLAICEEHYYSKSTGQVVQQARLNEEARVN